MAYRPAVFRAARRRGPLLALALLGACETIPPPPPAAVLDVPSAYTQKVPGRWALAVVGNPLNTQVEAKGFACNGLTFPVNLDGLFQHYIALSFRQIADDVTPSDRVLSDDELRAGGYAGQIVIGAATLVPDVAFTQDGLTALVDSNMGFNATLDVGSRGRRLVHRVFTVNGISHVNGGIICQNGAGGLARAVDSALQQMAVGTAAAFDASADVRLSVASL